MAEPQPGAGRRTRSRVIVVGALAAVAAAAMMLFGYFGSTSDASGEVARLPESAVEPVRSLPLVGPDATSDLQREALLEPADPAFLVYVQPLPDPLEIPPDHPFREQALEVNADPVRMNTIASFRAALVNELGTIPGLRLVDAESQMSAAAARSVPRFRLSAAGLVFTSPAGEIIPTGGRYVDVRVGAARVHSDGKATMVPAGFSARIDLRGGCKGAPATAICADVPGAAAQVVRQLREKLFPPDPAITRQRQSRLLDGALEPAQRFKALEELIDPLDWTGGTAQAALADPVTVRGLLDLAASGGSTLRARIWRSVRGVAHPDLLAPLQASAINDADEPRLEAVATLAADFADDPRARVTLESVAATDARALVRALATRGLSGEESWRAYINTSLHDTSRPAAERVEAFVYQHNLPTHEQPRETGQTYPAFSMLDEAGIDVLARLLTKASEERPATEGRMVRVANAIAPTYRSNAAVTDALLHYLRHGSSTNTRRIAIESLGHWRRDEQRVRDALQETLRNDPDPGVRDWVRQVMGEDFAATRP
jgi:hypothetical protein